MIKLLIRIPIGRNQETARIFAVKRPVCPLGENARFRNKGGLFMVKLKNHLGAIDISQNFFVNLVGATATSCFGVAGMAVSDPAQGFLSKVLRGREDSRGVKIRSKNGRLVIDLHIIVMYGTNISAIVKSIMHKVSYTVEDVTGIQVDHVNVYVDGMRTS